MFDIESLSMLLTTKSRRRKNKVPPDTFTGMRTRSAARAIGPNIFKLSRQKEKMARLNFRTSIIELKILDLYARNYS